MRAYAYARIGKSGYIGNTAMPMKIPNVCEFADGRKFMEKTIENYLCRRVRGAGGLALKLVCPGWTGVPDRIILMPKARVYFAEAKDAGKRPRPRQDYVHGRLRELGFLVFVPDSKEAVDDMVNTITGGTEREIHSP